MTAAVFTTGAIITPADLPYFDYVVYGLRLRSRIKLTLEETQAEGIADIELRPGDDDQFESAISQVAPDHSDWMHVHELAGGWSYVRYDEMFEFLISPSGEQILYRFLDNVPMDSFEAYALGRIFSFALVKIGHEPLHAAAVVIGGRAIAILGASLYGKSSLAACFVGDGGELLSDDVLRVAERECGYAAFPGPPRLKLLPRIARLYLRDRTVCTALNTRHPHPKHVYRMTTAQTCTEPVMLAGIYVVTPPRKVHRKQGIRIGSLPAVEALVHLLRFTHNHHLTSKERLARQFNAASRLIDKVPIRSLSYPRDLVSLPRVKAAILADLRNYADLI